MRALIIEDEINNQEFLESAINRFVSDIEIKGIAANVKDAVQLINKEKPDLIFLDIELPDGSGFNVLEQIENKDLNVIFTTAFENYALKAFRFSAIDYLLKPLNIDELIEATERARTNKENNDLRISFLQEQLNEPTKATEQIVVGSYSSYIKINLNDVIAIVTELNAVCVLVESGEKIYTTQTLKFFEDLLDQNKFLRIHRSHIININKIEHIDKGRTGFVTLTNQTKYEVAARRKPMLMELFNK